MMCGCMCFMVAHFFFKSKSPQKSILQYQIFEFFYYHGFNGNKVHVPKAITPILIKADLHISNIYTSQKKNEKKNYVKKTYENMAQFLSFKSA